MNINKFVDQNILMNGNWIVDLLEKDESFYLYDEIENLYQKQCDCNFDCDCEEELQEIFTWYIVSERLANRLSFYGEPIFKYENVYFWGRGTYGQMICADYVIEKIFNDIMKGE